MNDSQTQTTTTTDQSIFGMAGDRFRKLAAAGQHGLRIVMLLPSLLIVLAVLWVMPWSPKSWFAGLFPGEPGKIIVDSPEIYTRERLINDRLEEHLWLNTQLKQATVTDDIFDGYLSRSSDVSISDRAVPSSGGGSDKSPLPDKQDHQQRIAFDEEFRLRSAVRDQIRQRILENQLDDRHDLFGNSLYILKFDATVVPSSRVGDRAYVRVAVHMPAMYDDLNAALRGNPGGPESVKPHVATYFREKGQNLAQWISLFEHWRGDLTGRLNESVTKEYEGFLSDRWLGEEYDELRRFIRSRVGAKELLPPELVALMDANAASFADIERIYLGAISLGRSSVHVAGLQNPGVAPERNASDIAASIGEFIGARTIKLVLGVELASTPSGFDGVRSVGDRMQFSVEPLVPFVDLYLTNPADIRGAPSFSMYMHSDTLYVIDDDCASAAAKSQQKTTLLMLDRWDQRPDRKVAYADIDAGFPQYEVTSQLYDIMTESNSVIHSSPKSLPRLSHFGNCDNADVLNLPSGLFNFVDRIAQADLYSYAVLPRQSVRATISDILNRVEVEGGFLHGEGEERKGIGVDARVDETRSGAVLRSEVTSFGSMDDFGVKDENKTVFGWIIDPSRDEPMVGDAPPQPMTESMMAIISVPAWWDELTLTIETGWIDEDGHWTSDTPALPNGLDMTARRRGNAGTAAALRDVNAGQSQTGPIQKIILPNTYEGIDALLLQIKRRKPVIVEADFEQTTVTACAPASILIRGNRLWRNSVVTLGAQEASEIKVMPNMEGILARFQQVEMPAELEGNSGAETLRVWTSEGMAELRQSIDVRIPESIEKTDRDLRRCPASLLDQALSRSAKAN